MRKGLVTDFREALDGWYGPVREVRVAIAELLRQVELAAFGNQRRPLDGVPVERKAARHLARRAEHRLVVPAPLGLRALERGSVPDRHQRVLQRRARGR